MSALTGLICFLLSSVFGQTHQLILTKGQNDQWLDSVKALPSDSQLLMIRDRLLSDTNIFIKQMYPDGIKRDDSLGARVYGYGKPLLMVAGYPIAIDNDTPPATVSRFSALLTEKYIRQVNIFFPNEMATIALFGAAARCGMIAMTVTKKKYGKVFKRWNKKFFKQAKVHP